MENKKGFTLIELLAIIVILAIIAVITVPIVLNIIENARKGAVQNSALGYIDAVDKYYASRLSVDSSFQLVDGIYSIVDNGYLSDGIGTYEVKFDGQAPANGFVQVVKGNAINACVGFEEYAVIITDGSISDTAKGICSSISEISGSSVSQLAVGTEYLFPYVSEGNDKEQSFTVPYAGYYKLEVWGAQGGRGNSESIGGYGGYAYGFVQLSADTILYVNVGGSGSVSASSSDLTNGGYNGGGGARYGAGTGGGATHIAYEHGILSQVSSSNLLIVAGGGGGGGAFGSTSGGSAGGGIGNRGTNYSSAYAGAGYGGTQTSGGTLGAGNIAGTVGTYGQGGNGGYENSYTQGSGAGGGGYYGGAGGSARNGGGGGGSGYLSSSDLRLGRMYCYGCSESTNTISTTGGVRDSVNCPNGYSSEPTTNCAKIGNGYAKITYVGSSYSSAGVVVGTKFPFPYISDGDNKEQVFNVPRTGYYKLEVWGAQGASVSSYIGGYGGYSSGIMHLNSNTDLYINIGGMGVAQTSSVSTGTSYAGGYNGGGHGYNKGSDGSLRTGGGGGASHIAIVSGTLSSLSGYGNTGGENISNEILIVAGGGASAYGYGSKWWNGNSGGGMTGGYSFDQSYAATQTTGYQFGQAGSSFGTGANYAGAGGGWYGGVSAWGEVGAGGGSGYIRNPELTSGVMYCYGCTENSNAGTRTISTTGSNRDSVNCPDNYGNNALSNCAKAGDGYAIITYLGESLN